MPVQVGIGHRTPDCIPARPWAIGYTLWNAVIGDPFRPVMAKPVSCGIPWASPAPHPYVRQTACMRRFTTPSPTPSTAINDSA